MSTVSVRFVGPDPVEVDLRGVNLDDPRARRLVEPGEVIEVPAEVAHGRDGEEVLVDGVPVLNPDSGLPEIVGRYGGLLDQPDKWQAVRKTKKEKD